MYQLLSQWTAEQTMDRYDPDRLDRGTPFARPVRAAGSGRWSRSLASVSRLRAAADLWVRRATLGPLPDRCAGDPAGQGW